MNEEQKEKRRLGERRRLLRTIAKMEKLKEIAEEVGEVATPGGDPFALELAARLDRMEDVSHRHGKRTAVSARERRRFRNGFTPRAWKSGEQKGLAILDKALLFMSTFRKRGLGFRQLHILMLVTGENGLSIQEAADICGVTFYAIRHSLAKMEGDGYVKTGKVKRVGGQSPLCTIEITEKGSAVMRALNRFDPNKIGDYDRMVAMAAPRIPTSIRLLQMQQILADGDQAQQEEP